MSAAAARLLPRSVALRWTLGVAGALLAWILVTNALHGIAASPSGPDGSAYATASDGVAGYAALLARYGHRVETLRRPPRELALAPGSTLFLLDPTGLRHADYAALRTFVNAGGWLVVGASDPQSLVDQLLPAAPPRWAAGATGTARVPAGRSKACAAAAVCGVATVVTAGEGRWSSSRRGRGVARAGPGGAELVTAVEGDGRIALLADPSPLENRLLASADDAQLGLELAGPRSRPDAFEESVHGFGATTGLAAIPTRWQWALFGLLAAALAFVAAHARRLGEVDPPAFPSAPARSQYVHALAAALARTRDPEDAAEAVRVAALAALAEIAGQGRDDPATLRRVGRSSGLADDELDALLARPADSAAVVAAGRARAIEETAAMNELRDRIAAEVGRVVVGSTELVDSLFAAFVLGGHVLLEGPPGVAKTLAAGAFARALGGEHRRIQFTPDMLPADLTGTLELRGSALEFRPGPLFANVVLADEINRTPPKTQAALLEAMQEGHVTIDGVPYPLPQPFLVAATQNPIEFEGTYPLPEAQLDRFLMRVTVPYPSEQDERAMLALPRAGVRDIALDDVRAVARDGDLARARELVEATAVSDAVAAYIVALVRQTRELPSVTVGASPRAAVHLQGVARVFARYAGRDFVTPDDVAAALPAVLGHRLLLSPDAELGRYGPADALAATLAAVAVPR